MQNQSSAALVVTAIVSIVAGAAAGWFAGRAGGPDGPGPIQNVATDEEPTSVRVLERLDALERQLGRRSADPSLERRSVASVDRAEIESVVRELLAERAEATGEDAPALNIEAVLAELSDVGSQSTRGAELWAQAKAAGKVDELIAAFERRAAENPNSSDAQADLGDAYIQKLLTANDVMSRATLSMQADKAYDAALAVDDTHWRARYSKAISYTFWPDFMGKKAEAIGQLEILVDQQELGAPQQGFAETYLVLGNLYEQQGKADQARAMWQRGLALHPDAQGLRTKLAN